MNQNVENLQKRGRPKLEEISSLIKEGVQSKSPIRCRFCKRAFPREKSLQAHQRIHTGERPYRCIHPGCHKSFVQSGQLRTHQRLHTGEKPFRCNECKNRFTHANRRCPDHPTAGVIRDEAFQNERDSSPTPLVLSSPNVTLPLTPSSSPLMLATPQKTNPSSGIKNDKFITTIETSNPKIISNMNSSLPYIQPTTPTRTALCNYENNLSYHLSSVVNSLNGSRCYKRKDEILGALALIELSRCH